MPESGDARPFGCNSRVAPHRRTPSWSHSGPCHTWQFSTIPAAERARCAGCAYRYAQPQWSRRPAVRWLQRAGDRLHALLARIRPRIRPRIRA